MTNFGSCHDINCSLISLHVLANEKITRNETHDGIVEYFIPIFNPLNYFKENKQTKYYYIFSYLISNPFLKFQYTLQKLDMIHYPNFTFNIKNVEYNFKSFDGPCYFNKLAGALLWIYKPENKGNVDSRFDYTVEYLTDSLNSELINKSILVCDIEIVHKVGGYVAFYLPLLIDDKFSKLLKIFNNPEKFLYYLDNIFLKQGFADITNMIVPINPDADFFVELLFIRSS